MELKVVYPARVPYLLVWLRSRAFFSKSRYTHRHGVFTHAAASDVYYVRRHTVDILLERKDPVAAAFACKYLKYVFGGTQVGLNLSDHRGYELLSTVNYIII